MGYADRKSYLVMDYVEGSTLAELLKSGRQFTVDECIQIASQACDALAAAHSLSIIHRDLKPANIILLHDPEGKQITVKLLDFGIAKVLRDEGDSLVARTQTGEVLGTPAYMSPEQCQGYQLEVNSDIYSLGCVMYELFTGVKAFSADSSLAVMMQHIDKMPRTFDAISPNRRIPVALEAAVFKALAKKPQDRYRNATDFKNALVAAAAGHKSSLKSFAELLKSRSTAKRADWRIFFITVLSLCTIAAATIALLQQPDWRQLVNEAETQSGDDSQRAATLWQALKKAKAAHASSRDIAAISQELATIVDQTNPQEACQIIEDAARRLRDTNDVATLASLLQWETGSLRGKDPRTAVAAAKELVDIAPGLWGQTSDQLSKCLITLGQAYYNAKDFVMAEREFQRALSIRLKISKKPTREEEDIREFLCVTYLAQGRPEKAQQMLEKWMAIQQATNSPSFLKDHYDEFKEGKAHYSM